MDAPHQRPSPSRPTLPHSNDPGIPIRQPSNKSSPPPCAATAPNTTSSSSSSATFDISIRPPRGLCLGPSLSRLSLLTCSELVYQLLRTSEPCSCSRNDGRHDVICSHSSKQIALKTIAKADSQVPSTTTIFNLSEIPRYLSTLSPRAHEQNAFHLTISSHEQKVSILCVHPDIITQPGVYHSFVATECFLHLDELPSPDTLPANNLTFIGVVSDDYCSTPRVRKAIAKVTTRGYQSVYQALSDFAERWTPPVVVTVREQTRLRSERKPRRPQSQLPRPPKRRDVYFQVPSESQQVATEAPTSPLVPLSPPSPPPAPIPPSRIPLPKTPVSPIKISRKRGPRIVTPLGGLHKRRRIFSPPHPRSISTLPLSPTASPLSHSSSVSRIGTDSVDARDSPAPPPYVAEETADPRFSSHISLVERTRQFLLATQRGRACADEGQALCDKWQLIGPPQDVSHEFANGCRAWGVAFEHERLYGVRLIMVPRTIKPPKKEYPVLCVYGCTKDDSLRWFSSHPKAYRHCGMYMGTHKNGPICPNFPPSLLATSDAECRNPRNLDGLDLFFREVRGPQTNFRVSLKVAGRALLEHMAVNLGMQEMASLYKIEKKKDLCTEPLCQPVGRT